MEKKYIIYSKNKKLTTALNAEELYKKTIDLIKKETGYTMSKILKIIYDHSCYIGNDSFSDIIKVETSRIFPLLKKYKLKRKLVDEEKVEISKILFLNTRFYSKYSREIKEIIY